MEQDERTVRLEQETSTRAVQQPELRPTTLLKLCQSEAMQRVLYFIKQCAGDDCSVLLLGETGVGKEVVAGAIYELSSRSERKLVVANCGGFTPTLIESELFGHERGAFTGAVGQRTGLIERADRGTLFLDEIGELLKENQTYLLRVLEGGTFRRLGGTEDLRSDFRLIAATNRDLTAMNREGVLRSDLFYRLMLFPITIPPLRQRQDDILPLAHHFTRVVGEKRGRNITLAPECDSVLLSREWKGNVRELKHAIERAIVLAGKEAVILPLHFENSSQSGAAPSDASPRECSFLEHVDAIAQEMEARHLSLAQIEERICRSVFKKHRGNVAAAARVLALDRKTLSKRLEV